MTKIKFIKSIKSIKKGAVMQVTQQQAHKLIDDGVAELFVKKDLSKKSKKEMVAGNKLKYSTK